MLPDDALASLCFYDFVRCYRKEKRSARVPDEGRLRRFQLKAPHCEVNTHVLIEFADPNAVRPGVERIPRVIGRSIPRRTQDEKYYATFMLAHFVPFSDVAPLQLIGNDIVRTFDKTEFSGRSKDVIKNWDAIHECEDEREAERLKKRLTKQNDSKQRMQAVKAMLPAEYLENPEAYILAEHDFAREKIDSQTLHMRCSLINASWLQPVKRKNGSLDTDLVGSGEHTLPSDLNDQAELYLKNWRTHIQQQANAIANARRGQLDPTRQTIEYIDLGDRRRLRKHSHDCHYPSSSNRETK